MRQLNLNPFKGDAFFLGLNHTACFAIHIKQVVGKTVAGFERKFADGDACCRIYVGLLQVTHLPPCSLQELVNMDAGKGFGRHAKNNNK